MGLGLNKFWLYHLQGWHNSSQGDNFTLSPAWSPKPPDLVSTNASSLHTQDTEMCWLCGYQPSPVLKVSLHYAPESMKTGEAFWPFGARWSS